VNNRRNSRVRGLGLATAVCVLVPTATGFGLGSANGASTGPSGPPGLNGTYIGKSSQGLRVRLVIGDSQVAVGTRFPYKERCIPRRFRPLRLTILGAHGPLRNGSYTRTGMGPRLSFGMGLSEKGTATVHFVVTSRLATGWYSSVQRYYSRRRLVITCMGGKVTFTAPLKPGSVPTGPCTEAHPCVASDGLLADVNRRRAGARPHLT
jgi:hypothetical protein